MREEQKKKVEMHKKSALESYWTVTPLFFFSSWFVYWCFNHLLSESERMKKGTGLESSLSLAPALCQNIFQNFPTVDFLELTA